MTEQKRNIRAEGAKAGRSIEEAIIKVGDSIDSETKGDSFPTLGDIEKLWDELNAETRKTYMNMFSGMISSIDEKELISSKKANSQKRG